MTEFLLAMLKTYESTKLFYGQYPYKITYVRLYGFPTQSILQNERWGWWFDVPSDDYDRTRRDNCLKYLRNLSIRGVKFSNSSQTHVYFMDKEVFEKAKKRYKELQREIHVPFIDNLAETLSEYEQNIEIKNSLYHKKYRYKITLKFDKHLENDLGPAIATTYSENENYHLNPNIRRFLDKSTTVQSYGRYTYRFRHSTYHTYAIYCREDIDMEMMTFIASENISKITKVVLKDELDK